MLTNITALSAKDIHFLQPYKSMKWAERQMKAAKDAIDSRILTVQHLADYWGLDGEELITQLRPRFGLK